MNTPLDHPSAVKALLNIAHAFDHLFLLIFAAAVSTIAFDFGFAKWEDLMPYGAGAFFLFGLGSLPSGRLGDLWGRRSMMLVFFGGIGASALLTWFAQNAWQLAACLTLIGAFASIYHPVGIPMLVMTAAAITSSVLFNFTTNSNGRLLHERFQGVMQDPTQLGMLLAVVYAIASIAQGWWLFIAITGVMLFIFGAIPFTDVMIARYVDDRMRSRVSGIRLGVSFAISSLCVFLIGPVVKSIGFESSLLLLACFPVVTLTVLSVLPSAKDERTA